MENRALRVEEPRPKTERGRIWTAANGFSLSRVFLLPFILYFLKRPDASSGYIALSLMVVAALTDVADGYLARRHGDVSEIGKLLDAGSDKIAIAGVVFALVYLKGFPLWIVVLALTRDIGIALCGLFLFRTGRRLIPSNTVGKYTTLMLAVTVLVFMLDLDQSVKQPVLHTTVALIFLSSFSYAVKFVRVLKKRPSYAE